MKYKDIKENEEVQQYCFHFRICLLSLQRLQFLTARLRKRLSQRWSLLMRDLSAALLLLWRFAGERSGKWQGFQKMQ